MPRALMRGVAPWWPSQSTTASHTRPLPAYNVLAGGRCFRVCIKRMHNCTQREVGVARLWQRRVKLVCRCMLKAGCHSCLRVALSVQTMNARAMHARIVVRQSSREESTCENTEQLATAHQRRE
jgi:hypothetical protein